MFDTPEFILSFLRATSPIFIAMVMWFVLTLIVCLLETSRGSPVAPSTVEERLQLLERAAELQYEAINDFDHRLSVLEKFVIGLLKKNTSDGYFSNNDANITAFETLQEKLNYELSQNTDKVPLLPRNAALRALPGSQVAFHAYATSSRPFSPNEVVIFDAALSNYGNGYTTSDGLFDAPVSGVYVLTWTISTSKFQHAITTNLIINGEVKGVLTSDSDFVTTTGTGSHPVTGIVVAYVQAGEHVFIRMINQSGDTSNLQSNNVERSTFSGWLLF